MEISNLSNLSSLTWLVVEIVFLGIIVYVIQLVVSRAIAVKSSGEVYLTVKDHSNICDINTRNIRNELKHSIETLNVKIENLQISIQDIKSDIKEIREILNSFSKFSK